MCAKTAITSDVNKEKYLFGDYLLIQYQILQTNTIRIVYTIVYIVYTIVY